MSYRYADQLSMDDDILVQINDNFVPAKITNVSGLKLQGNDYSLCFFCLCVVLWPPLVCFLQVLIFQAIENYLCMPVFINSGHT